MVAEDNWIGAQALALLRRRPMGKPFFIEVSHQAPHPPMDVTAGMVASNGLRSRRFPLPVECMPGEAGCYSADGAEDCVTGTAGSPDGIGDWGDVRALENASTPFFFPDSPCLAVSP